MRLVFMHRTAVEYTTETPYLRSIGGTESAVAYLTAELAKLGHSVVLLANPSEPGRYLGVDCLHHKTGCSKELLSGADAIVVSNEACGRKLRDLGIEKPLVLWTQHTDEQQAVLDLEYSRERKAWSAFAFVSQWQQREYCDTFWLPEAKTWVMRNAIAPAFAEHTPKEPWFMRDEPPVLVYTSAPYRGLSVLLASFPLIRAEIPGARLRVFSGISTTRGTTEDCRYADLYHWCLATEGVEYVGPLPQPTLAEELSEAAALVYPSIFPETFCVAAIEAMSMGALVLTTRLGALPETIAGFGRMVELRNGMDTLAKDFAVMAIHTLRETRRNRVEAALQREAQLAYSRRHYSWPARAIEWQTQLRSLVASFESGALAH